jgi:phosphatidate cytidylyltransferase
MKELAVRALSGAVYVALVLGAAWVGAWATCALFLPLTLIATNEWQRLRRDNAEGAPSTLLANSIAAVAYMAFASIPFWMGLSLVPFGPSWHIASLLVVVLILQVLLFRSAVVRTTNTARDLSDDPVQKLLSVVLGIAMPMACATWLVAVDAQLFIGFMLLLWTNDTGAYLVGKSIGRNKLMPKVSPGKTWEGLLGGIALAVLVGWFWSAQCPVLPKAGWLIAAVVVSITATAGDLFESALKRAAGVKDSGTIMPGHGGVLDRFDGYLLAAPAMVAVWALLGIGVL